LIQAVLVLQPTHTGSHKRTGTYIHAALVDVAILCFFVAFVIIEVNKSGHPGSHFKSAHGIMGMITYCLILVQSVVGVLQFFFQDLLGGPDKAKSIYKYHRISGYTIVTLGVATVCAATWTDYNILVLGIHQWAVITAGVILLAGLFARVKIAKLGF
jgi:Eukaryotic cytochrome b561